MDDVIIASFPFASFRLPASRNRVIVDKVLPFLPLYSQPEVRTPCTSLERAERPD